jgi:tetratricopeptide (TPR) repeat protein
MSTIAKTLVASRKVEEKFSKIQNNPALNGAENGFTQQELELLNKIIELCGEVNIAGDAISKSASSVSCAATSGSGGGLSLNKAIDDYTQAIRLDPDNAAAYSNRGNAYYGKGDYQRTRADWEQALRLDPNNATARSNLELLRQQGY